MNKCQMIMFQSAPRSVERGDPKPQCKVRTSSFNPRPAQSSGATGETLGLAYRMVSIRAPLSRAGRPSLRRLTSGKQLFQSAPRSVERGNSVYGEDCARRMRVFQSAPRSVERGDPVEGASQPRLDEFQSAPRSVERGDIRGL